MKKYLMVSGCALLCIIAMLSYAFAIDITADMTTKEGKITRIGKLYLRTISAVRKKAVRPFTLL
jgi:hypothetical protein